MKILLISANTLTSPYPVYPLGLDYVANAIGADHQVKIADMNDVGNYDSLGNIIRHFSPDIIGMSLRNADNTDTSDPRGFVGNYQELTAAIREYSDARLVLGGSGFTIFPAEFMKVLKADYGIIGEGERLALLLNALEKQEDVAIPQKRRDAEPSDKAGMSVQMYLLHLSSHRRQNAEMYSSE